MICQKIQSTKNANFEICIHVSLQCRNISFLSFKMMFCSLTSILCQNHVDEADAVNFFLSSFCSRQKSTHYTQSNDMCSRVKHISEVLLHVLLLPQHEGLKQLPNLWKMFKLNSDQKESTQILMYNNR
jgi:hypothetical protein